MAEAAQVAANRERAIKVEVHQRAAIEAVAHQRFLGLALWAVFRTIPIGVGDGLQVLLDRAGERV